MVEPSLFFDVLGVAAAFLFVDAVVVFPELKMGNLPRLLVQFSRPAEDRFGEWVDREGAFVHDECDEQGIFIDNDGAAAAEPFDDGNALSFDRIDIEQFIRLSGDSHHDGSRRAVVEDAKISPVGPEERLFELELLKNGGIFELDQMDFRANN